jgi:sugar lactone lactonase YvrE
MNFLRDGKFIRTAVLSIALACTVNAQTADEMRESAKFESQARADYKAKDYAKFLENIKRAADLRPNHARLLYNLAVANALNGKTNEALAVLNRLQAMDLYFDIQNDEDFDSLKKLTDSEQSKEFMLIQARFVFNQQARNRAARAFALPEKDLLIEGIAYDAVGKRFFVSSLYKRKIVVTDAQGKAADFSSDADGLWSVAGMRVDDRRRVLWATVAAQALVPDFQKADEGKSAVFKYDLKTGKLLKIYVLPDDGAKHVLGDLVIAKNGDVYASDSLTSRIYRIGAGRDELEIFLAGDAFASLQGLAFSPDEKYMFAADYSKGVFKIEMTTKKVSQLKIDAATNPIGIDGLYFYGGNLIVIQNGFRPFRVARFFLNKDFSAVLRSETLEVNHADMEEPTLGTIVGKDFYFVANSQQSLLGKEGLATDKLKEPVILRLKL